MEEITLNLKSLKRKGLNINEYLILLDLTNDYQISSMFNYNTRDLINLEKKGYIKLMPGEIVIRAKAKKLFKRVDENNFLKWLNTYPVKVQKKFGGTRALSPSKESTILGKKLKAKWQNTFKGDVELELRAIKVLEAELEMYRRSGGQEYMVEAHRWLNEGYFEKYEYLLDEEVKKKKTNNYEDFM